MFTCNVVIKRTNKEGTLYFVNGSHFQYLVVHSKL